MLIVAGVVTVLLLTALTGFFVAQEFAYVSVDRNALRTSAANGEKSAERALGLTGRLSFLLSGAQLGITVTTLLVGYAAEPLIGAGLRDALGLPADATGATVVGISLSVLLFSTIVQMVLGELGPKNLAIARAEPLATALATPTTVYLRLFGWLIRVFDTASTRFLGWFGVDAVEELPSGATSEELHRIIGKSRASGLLDAELSDLLDRGLAFRHRTVEEVMTPRVDVETIGADDSVADLVRLLESGHSRFPVIGRDIDDVTGLVTIAHVLEVPVTERKSTPVKRIAGEPVRLPTSLPLGKALEQLRNAHRQVAVVVDEHGGFAGLVSFEDIAEEVVGDILDEDDDEESPASERPDGAWVLPAKLRLDEVLHHTGVELPVHEDYDTLSGLVLKQLGRVSEVGDEATVSWMVRDSDGGAMRASTVIEVTLVERHVPDEVVLHPVMVDDPSAAVAGEEA